MSIINGNPKASAIAVRPFVNSQEHLRAEMAWLELLLKRELRVAMRPGGKLGPVDEFAGMYVSEDEIRHYLDDAEPRRNTDNADATVVALEERIQIARLDIDRRVAASIKNGIDLRLPQLAHRFD